jgi:DNA replication initiation complex subunit (GINS family)
MSELLIEIYGVTSMYDEIYNTWLATIKKERIKIDKEFSRRSEKYLDKLRNEISIKEGLIKKIYQTKIDNLSYIINCIENFCSPNYIIDERQDLANQIYENKLDNNEKINGEKNIEPMTIISERDVFLEEPKYLIIRILESIPSIVGSDLRTYGPYNPEDIAAIPIKNANILIKRGAAVQINWGNKNEDG